MFNQASRVIKNFNLYHTVKLKIYKKRHFMRKISIDSKTLTEFSTKKKRKERERKKKKLS
ncbi:hypothetical protein V1478_010902 [Vespula squamosa]|uniref:Uncharacterized protein n=1 Tax=Vespula squamosa TaxID=30214 RepID=A0ABD2AHX3_VESSQ